MQLPPHLDLNRIGRDPMVTKRDVPFLIDIISDISHANCLIGQVPVGLALAGLWLHRAYRAIVYRELDKGLPWVVTSLAEWADYFFGTSDSANDAGGGTGMSATSTFSAAASSSSSSSATSSASGGSGGAGGSSGDSAVSSEYVLGIELESDTVVAVLLFVLMALVLLHRSRLQARFRLQQQQQQQQQRQQLLRQERPQHQQHAHQD